MTKLIYNNNVTEDYDPKDFFERMKKISDISYTILNELTEKSTKYAYMVKGVAVLFNYASKPKPNIHVRLFGLSDYSEVEKIILNLLPKS